MDTGVSFQVMIVASYAYEWAVQVAARLFAKYWPGRPVLYFADRFTGPFPDNVTPIRVPCYSEGVWPWAHWFGQGLISICEYLEEWPVLFLQADHWLNAPVDGEGIGVLAHYMSEHPDVIRGNVTAGTPLEAHGHEIVQWYGYSIIAGDPRGLAGFDAALTFCPSLWNPTALKQIIEPGWTFQQCEALGTKKMLAQAKYRTVGILPPPLSRAHVLRHAQPHTVFMHDVAPEDRAMCRGWVRELWSIAE